MSIFPASGKLLVMNIYQVVSGIPDGIGTEGIPDGCAG